MRVMVMIESTPQAEEQEPPGTEVLEAMSAYNDRLIKAGVMLDGQGLKPTSTGARVIFDRGTTSVVDGPFTESKEVIAGYWIWQVGSMDEAIEWAKQCPANAADEAQLELRPIFEEEDFGESLTPELKEKQRAMAAEIDARSSN